MRCFGHRDREAIAVCQGCGRALCEPCVTSEKERIVVCSSACSRRVEFTRSALRVLYRNAQKSNRVGALFLLTIGAACGAIAFFAALSALRAPSPHSGHAVRFLVPVLGAVFLGGYGVLLWRAQDATLLDEADQEPPSASQRSPTTPADAIGDRSMRERWTTDDIDGFGRRIYEAVPERERAGWAADLLELCTIVAEPMPAVDTVVAIGRRPTRAEWFAAHAAFRDVRDLTLAEEGAPSRKPVLRCLLDVAETAAKVTYNASGGSAPFDFHAGWRMAPRLRALVVEARDPGLEERVWRRLSSSPGAGQRG